MRSPDVAQMTRTSFTGQFRSTSLTLPPMLKGDIQAARPAEDVPELQTCLADGRIVDDRQEPGRVGHQHLVEERLVRVKQLDQINVPFEVGGLLAELLQGAPHLGFFGVHRGGQEAGQAQRLPLGLSEGGGLVKLWVAQEVDPALRDAHVGSHVRDLL